MRSNWLKRNRTSVLETSPVPGGSDRGSREVAGMEKWSTDRGEFLDRSKDESKKEGMRKNRKTSPVSAFLAIFCGFFSLILGIDRD